MHDTVPKANVVLRDGTKVTIEGTTAEVASLLELISTAATRQPDDQTPRPARRRRGKVTGTGPGRAANAKTRSKGPADYIRELAEADYFKTKRGLRDVQKRLEEGAHIYPVTHLSPVLFRFVRLKELRRIKEDGTWKYVNP
jgi:hypothetical protein